MIRLNEIKFRYAASGQDFELGPLTLEIPAGRLVFWSGNNGSGKSTAARILAGELTPSGGSLLKVPGRVFYYAQRSDENMFPELTVRQHFRALGGDWREGLRQAVEKFPEIDGFLPLFPDELSTGQLQLVTFSLVLARRYPVLIFDEVLNHLDFGMRQRVLTAIASTVRGSADRHCVVISHDAILTRRFADFIHVFRQGRVIACTSPEEADGLLQEVPGETT